MNTTRTLQLSAIALFSAFTYIFFMTTLATAQTPSRAVVETVTTLADSGAGSLRQAVADVDVGGTIIFDNSISGDTITLASAIALNKNLTISGTMPITISGGGSTHIFNVGGNATVQLDGLTLRDGDGGGLLGDGGAIGVSSATLLIYNSTFHNNNSSNGGAIQGGSSFSLVISSTTFLENSASNGGAIEQNGSNAFITIVDSTFDGNQATNGFGGHIQYNGAIVDISNSTFQNGSANGGGAIYVRNNDLTIRNSTFSGNSAGANGGGALLLRQGGDPPNIVIENTTITDNSTTSGGVGGGIRMFNQAGSFNVTLRNTLVAGNLSGGDCINEGNIAVFTANAFNLDSDGSCANATTAADPLLAPLQDNGGATATHALLTGSPAIDAGDNATCLATDQRGVARPQGATCDIGAYEAEPLICSNPANVSTEGELNDAIACFNAATVAATYVISITDNISLTAATTAIDNATADIDLLIDGNAFALDGQNSERGFVIAGGSDVTITQLTIQNGYTDGHGGGIYNDGSVTINQSVLMSNSADLDGAGIYNQGTVELDHSTIHNNAAGSDGGGIANSDNGRVTLRYSTVSGNSAVVNGGGLWTERNISTIVENSTFSGNSSGRYGAGISNNGRSFQGPGDLTVRNSTFSGNSAGFDGGGVDHFNSTLTIYNSTFSDNSARSGGGLHTYSSSTVIAANNIIANSVTGGDCSGQASFATSINNLIEDNSCTPAISGDPNLGALQNNGGATQTHALLPFSPALEAGDNATCLANDQRGVARPQGATCDIGAYEAEPPICTNPANVSTEGELNDAIACFNTVTVAGTYTISFTASISLTAATTEINNATADIELLIAGNGHFLDGQNGVRGLTIAADTHVTVDALTILNGRSDNGAAIRNLGTLIVTNSELRDNLATGNGGGIYSFNMSVVTVTNSCWWGMRPIPAAHFGTTVAMCRSAAVACSPTPRRPTAARLSQLTSTASRGVASSTTAIRRSPTSVVRHSTRRVTGGDIQLVPLVTSRAWAIQ